MNTNFKLALSLSSTLNTPQTNIILQLSSQISFENEEAISAERLAINSTNQSVCSNKEFKTEMNRRTNRDYPCIYVIVSSLMVLLFSISCIYIERIQVDRFELDDLYVFSYRTFSGLTLYAAVINLVYSFLAILTSKEIIMHNFNLTC